MVASDKYVRAVGVISDSPLQRLMLNNALAAYHIDVNISCEPTLFFEQTQERIDQVGCWVIDLEDDSFDIDQIMDHIDETDAPFLLGIGAAPQKHEIEYISWERRLRTKLEEHIGSFEELETEASIKSLGNPSTTEDKFESKPKKSVARTNEPADEIWVLAASLGGPAAVKEFIDELPADLGIGFLYAQHVDAHFSAVLTDVLGRHSCLDLVPMKANRPLCQNEIQVVPVDEAVSFENSLPKFRNTDWSGPYGPSIDELLINLHAEYGSRCHAIIFSGMGNDSALAVPRMKASGCHIWTQTPDTCANSSMPQSVIDLGCSEKIDSPKNLARALVNIYQRPKL